MTLQQIFDYYKLKYNLNADLMILPIKEEELGYYNIMTERIIIDKLKIKIQNPQNWTGVLVFVLLHEIKHAIDFRNKFNSRNPEKDEIDADKWAERNFQKLIKLGII